MMKQTREQATDFVGDQRESMIMKARQNLGLKKRTNSSRREIGMAADPPQQQKPHLVAPGMSATVGRKRPPTGVQRQKTTGLNSDIPTDLLLEAHNLMKTGYVSTTKLHGANSTGTKPRVPIQKRGKSAHPSQKRPPISQNDLTKFSWSGAVSGAHANVQNYSSAAGLHKR